MSVDVAFTIGKFPQGACFNGLQQYADDLVSLLTGTISGNFSGIIIGSNTPDPSDRDKAWLRLNNDGTPDRLYVYLGGWLALNSRPANSKEVIIWKDTEAALWSYDGGDGTDPGTNPPTSTTGAMWVRDTAFDFKMPIGAGTNGTAYDGNPASVITQGSSTVSGGSAGEERHVLITTEIPAHTHTVPLYAGDAVNHANRINTTDELTVQDLSYQSGSTGGDKSHNNLPPFLGVFFARRSSRVYYVA